MKEKSKYVYGKRQLVEIKEFVASKNSRTVEMKKRCNNY